jgi:hypothetical protein
VVYSLGPRWDLGASAFGTPVALPLSSSDLGSVIYFGLNLRVGYKFGFNWFGANYRLMLGTYSWGMLTSSDYGISFLAGPQVFFTFSKETSGRKAFFGYLKFAPTAEKLSALSLGSREVALGLGYRLSPLEARRRVDLTLDMSDTVFKSDELGLSSNLDTVTAGVQVGF